MSKRHRPDPEAQPPKIEVRAHAHGERHRINSELQRVTNEVCGGLEPDDALEPGASWKPVHHHNAARAKAGARPGAALEAQDVEAPQRGTQGQGASHPPRRRRGVALTTTPSRAASRRSRHSSAVMP